MIDKSSTSQKIIEYLRSGESLIFFIFFAVMCRSFMFVSSIYFTAIPFFLFFIIKYRRYFFEESALCLSLSFIVIFTLWSALTALWSPFPLVSISRAGWFFIVASGSTIIGYWATSKSWNNIYSLYWINIVIVAVSLISFLTSFPSDSWTGGNNIGFKGFSVHQNSLGAVILFTLPFCFLYLSQRYARKQPSSFKEIFFSIKSLTQWLPYFGMGILILANGIMLILSQSRGSLLAFFVFI